MDPDAFPGQTALARSAYVVGLELVGESPQRCYCPQPNAWIFAAHILRRV
jgi:hypothetical protein